MLRSEPVRRHCHAKLKPGEYKRVPKPLSFAPVGYYFACIECGFLISVRTKFINERDGLPVKERQGKLIAIGPLVCDKCGHRFAVKEGRYARA